MPAISRTTVRRLLVAVGTIATAAAVAICLTGGFVTRVGPVRISARGLDNPLIIAGLSWLLLAVLERAHLPWAARQVTSWVEIHAVSIAVVLAAGCAGTGVAFGTFAAHATDPSAYVSHAKLLLSGPLVRVEPLVSAFDWHGGAWNFSPLGYRPGVGATEIVPTYPLGLPAVIAALRAAFGEFGSYFAVPLLGAALVLGCFCLAAHLHSRLAGLVAAALAASSPILLFHVLQPMSDVPAAAWLVLALLGALGDGWASGIAAGFCLGMLGATRPNLAPLSLAVALCAVGWPIRGPRQWRIGRIAAVGLGILPVMVPLMALNTRLYGSPVATGYGNVDQYFTLLNVGQNVRDYAWRIGTGETAAVGLAVVAIGLLVTVGRGRVNGPDGAPGSPGAGLWTSGALAALVGALMLALYLPYGIFPDWAYLRFLLPGLAVAWVFVGALVAAAVSPLSPTVRGPLVAALVLTTAAVNISVARREQVFNLRFYESRYRTVGHYLRETLPPDAVVLTFQESGAIRYYTGVPIVRWDYLPLELDAAVDALRQHGLHPMLVIEDWEIPNLRARFPKSALAALDWTPRADIGQTTHVWILDPEDRESGKQPVTDRFR